MYFCVSTVHCPKVIYVSNEQLFTVLGQDSQTRRSPKSVSRTV